MSDKAMVTAAADVIRARVGDVQAKIAIVLGSGLGGLADRVEGATKIAYADIPGFAVSTVPGHAGAIIHGTIDGVELLLFAGRVHFYETGQADAMALPLKLAKALGVETVFLSNAAGSTRRDMGPGTLMLITDHVNWSGGNPLIGRVGETGFVDLTQSYDPALCDDLRAVAQENAIALAEGVYGWFSGPSYETPAEIRMVAKLGIDAVGMSTVPETILARAFGLRVAAVSLITNYGAGLGDGLLDHKEVQEEGAKAAKRFEALVVGLIKRLAAK